MFCGKHIKTQKYGIYQLKGTNNIENYIYRINQFPILNYIHEYKIAKHFKNTLDIKAAHIQHIVNIYPNLRAIILIILFCKVVGTAFPIKK